MNHKQEFKLEDRPDLIIVIPAYKEPNPSKVLDALLKCSRLEKAVIEVIYLFNASEASSVEIHNLNQKGYREVCNWEQEHRPIFKLIPLLHNDLPDAKAGVGLARKIGMDMACERFLKANNPNGLLVCLDADCDVSENYLDVLIQFYKSAVPYKAASIRFEHPMPEDPDMRRAIECYELHLRYFIEAQRWLELPYAYHTIGSAMAVRAEMYKKSGGMNTRKAGEDFYFIHKQIKSAPFTEINEAIVYPEARISDRVPFGTGRAMMENMEQKRYENTYALQTFEILKIALDDIRTCIEDSEKAIQPFLKGWHPELQDFLKQCNFEGKWNEIRNNTNNSVTRLKRFFHWFDGFLLMKWCHYYRDQHLTQQKTEEAAHDLLKLKYPDIKYDKSNEQLLQVYRLIQTNVYP